MNDLKTSPDLVVAFQLMWGNFPDPMMLVHRDRTILAVNGASAAQGAEPGRKCYTYNPDPADVEDGACKGCQANKALASGTAIYCECKLGGKRSRGYWIPLKGSRELYLHGFTSLSTLPVVA